MRRFLLAIAIICLCTPLAKAHRSDHGMHRLHCDNGMVPKAWNGKWVCAEDEIGDTAPAPALVCNTVSETQLVPVRTPGSNQSIVTLSVSCPVGTVLTGGGCKGDILLENSIESSSNVVSGFSIGNGWGCHIPDNPLDQPDRFLTPQAICCSIE